MESNYSHAMSSVDEKITILKKKITCRSIKSIFSEHDIKNSVFSEGQVFDSTYKSGS